MASCYSLAQYKEANVTSEQVTRSTAVSQVSQPAQKPLRRNVFHRSGAGGPAFAIIAGTLAAPAYAQTTDTCSGYTVCPVVDYQQAIANDPDIRSVNNGITQTEAQTLSQIQAGQFSTD